jgi:hypothetical protein
VEGKGRVLREVKVADQTSKVQGGTMGVEQVLSAQILNREAEMVHGLILERGASKVQSWLRQQTVDSADGVLGVLRLMQQGEQTEHKRGRDREVTVEIGQTRAQESAHLLAGQTLEDNVTEQIETTTTGTTGTLAVIEGSQED